MKYLFYDLEFASCKDNKHKICEFGYVVTNEKFEILESNNLIINPNLEKSEWDLTALEKILTRTIEEYQNYPIFKERYTEIEKLITSADYVFGHTSECDAQALNDDLKRYKLKAINFTFYDIKIFYKYYGSSKEEKGLYKILEELNVEAVKGCHDAKIDAHNTMLALKAICENLEFPVERLIELCPRARDKTENYIVESHEINRMIRNEKNNRRKKRKVLYINEEVKSSTLGELFPELFKEILERSK